MKKNSWISLSPHLKPGELIKFAILRWLVFNAPRNIKNFSRFITRDTKNVVKRTRVMICCKINQRILYTKTLFCIHKSLILAPMKNHLATAWVEQNIRTLWKTLIACSFQMPKPALKPILTKNNYVHNPSVDGLFSLWRSIWLEVKYYLVTRFPSVEKLSWQTAKVMQDYVLLDDESTKGKFKRTKQPLARIKRPSSHQQAQTSSAQSTSVGGSENLPTVSEKQGLVKVRPLLWSAQTDDRQGKVLCTTRKKVNKSEISTKLGTQSR